VAGSDRTDPAAESPGVRDAGRLASPAAKELATKLEPLLAGFLPRQRWFAGDHAVGEVTVTALEVRRQTPLLLWMLFDVELTPENGQPGDMGPTEHVATYQLLVAGRAADAGVRFLEGKDRVTLGELDGMVLYDALVDPELALEVLTWAAPDEHADVARPLLVEQTNTSVVYDERLILKLFRRLHPGPNPDVEVTRVLGHRGFPHVVRQRAELRRNGFDVAVVRDYLLGATDAWQLAHTSLRDLLGSRLPPEESGADFAAEAATLGAVTAELHVALAGAFGRQPTEPAAWLDTMLAQAARMPAIGLGRDRIVAALEGTMQTVIAPGAGQDAGAAIRIHGDLHLGQFLRSDTGWFVLDFEGEPARPPSERRSHSSPLRDVAGMLRSFDYAGRTVLAERGRDVDRELLELTEAWEERARDAFWEGYLSVPDVAELLPHHEANRAALRRAFELDKAVYEVIYELKHRPSWVDIPASALERMIGPMAS
jgi:maltokinase